MARWPGLMLPRAANVRMSALLPTADIHHGDGYVSFVPQPDSWNAATASLFGAAEQARHSLLRRRRPEECFQSRSRIVNQRLLVSIEHLVAHRRGEGLGSALAASP
jgi:hypothetical protein